jgi:hypothetical protein
MVPELRLIVILVVDLDLWGRKWEGGDSILTRSNPNPKNRNRNPSDEDGEELRLTVILVVDLDLLGTKWEGGDSVLTRSNPNPKNRNRNPSDEDCEDKGLPAAYLATATAVPATALEESPQHRLTGARKGDLEPSSYGLGSRASNAGA